MKTRLFFAVLVGVLAISVVFPINLIWAGPGKSPHARKKPFIPPHAVEVAPGLYSLGTAVHKGKVVEGYMIITPFKKRYAKPGCNNDGFCDPGEKKNCSDCRSAEPDASDCYGYLSKGAIWKTPETFVVNTYNFSSLNGDNILTTLNDAIVKWEVAAGANILDTSNDDTGSGLEADEVAPDGDNEVYFHPLGDPHTVAYTIVWGIFRGSPSGRRLIEWDQVYNDDFEWDDCLQVNCTNQLDFDNVATHEIGHAVGMDDLYTSKCSEQTMYGYVEDGEIKKRDLADGDKTGIWHLYH